MLECDKLGTGGFKPLDSVTSMSHLPWGCRLGATMGFGCWNPGAAESPVLCPRPDAMSPVLPKKLHWTGFTSGFGCGKVGT